ncbi:MAG: hypothetical protein ACP5JF_05175 [Candidatus Methanodesulfokora sp.]
MMVISAATALGLLMPAAYLAYLSYLSIILLLLARIRPPPSTIMKALIFSACILALPLPLPLCSLLFIILPIPVTDIIIGLLPFHKVEKLEALGILKGFLAYICLICICIYVFLI